MSKTWKSCGIENMKNTAIGNVQGAVEEYDGFFIPYANYKSQGQVSGIIKTMGKRVDRKFDPNVFGKQWHIDRSRSHGLKIVFNPTKVLINAAKAKAGKKRMDEERRKAEERNRNDELYSSRKVDDFEVDADKLNDSYNRVLAHKKEQKEFIERELAKAESKFRVEGGIKEEERVNKLSQLLSDLENDIKALNNKDEEILHKVIRNDIQQIKEVLESDNAEDLGTIKKTIDFYKAYYPIFESNDEIERSLTRLFKEGYNQKGEYVPSGYDKAIRKKTIRVLKNDPSIKEKLEYLNTSEEQAVKDLRKELKRKEVIEEEGDEITIEHLFYRNADIDSLIMNFTTITDGYDNILPQVVMNMLNNQQNQELNHVLNLRETIDKLKAENPDIDTNDFFDENKRLINIYTTKFSDALQKRYKYINNFWDATKTHQKVDKYQDIISWHKANTDIIDIRKIQDVYTKFGDKYSEYFEASEEEMQKYEQSIIDRIGTLEWEKMKQRILKQLARYDEMREEFTDPSDFKNFTKVVRNNIWEFTKNYFGKGSKEYGYIREKGVKQFYTGFYNGESSIGLHFIPKDIKEKDFYSKDFKEIAKDDKKYKLWQAYREALIYINQTYYGESFESFYAPKISKSVGEKAEDVKNTLVKTVKDSVDNIEEKTLEGVANITKSPLLAGSKLGSILWHEWRSLYHSRLPEEQKKAGNEIISNNLDNSRAEFKEHRQLVKLNNPKKTDEEIDKMTSDLLAETYSTDIDKSITANLLAASLHQARLKTEPKADMVLQTYKNIRTGKDGNNGKIRKNSINKFEHYLKKVIYNNANEVTKEGWWGKSRGKWLYKVGQIMDKPFLPKTLRKIGKSAKGSYRVFSPQEALLVKNIEEYINKNRNENEKITFMDAVFSKELKIDEIQHLIDETGVERNAASIVEGMLRASIIRHLGINPASAVMQRMEGKITNLMEDLRGEFWTPGNIHAAHDMMSYSNFLDATQKANPYYDTADGKIKTMRTFRALIQRIGGLQDRKDELQKSSKINTTEGFITNALFSWSVTKPEFKNQGADMLAIMMDSVIVDDNGVEHPFVNKETKQFTAIDIDATGALIIKEGFKKSFSLSDAKTSEANKTLLSDIAYKSQLAISQIHGNYSSFDAILAKASIAGKALLTFKTWLPANVIKRWGMFNKNGNIDFNPATGKLKRDGFYIETIKGAPGAMASKFGVDAALAYNMLPSSILGWVGVVGGGALAGIMAYKYLKGLRMDHKSEAEHLKVSALFILETLKNTTTFLPKMLSVAPKSSKIIEKLDSYDPMKKAESLTPNQIKAVKTVAMEIAVKLNLLGFKLLFGALLWDDDDPKGSSKRRYHYFLQNLIWKNIDAIQMYSSPDIVWNTMTETTLINDVLNIYKLADAVSQGEFEDSIDAMKSLTPIPSDILSVDKTDGFQWFKNPFQENSALDTNPFINITGKYTWVNDMFKNYNTEGMYGMEKEWREMRKDIALEIDRRFDNTLNKKELETLKRAVKSWIFMKRPPNLPPKEFRKFIDAQDPDRKIENFGYRDIGQKLYEEIYTTEYENAGELTEEERKELNKEILDKTNRVIKILKEEIIE